MASPPARRRRRRNTSQFVKLSYRFIEDALGRKDYPDVRQPALMFHGARDDVVPVKLSRRFASGRPNVTLLETGSGRDLANALDFMWEKTWAFLQARLSAPGTGWRTFRFEIIGI